MQIYRRGNFNMPHPRLFFSSLTIVHITNHHLYRQGFFTGADQNRIANLHRVIGRDQRYKYPAAATPWVVLSWK